MAELSSFELHSLSGTRLTDFKVLKTVSKGANGQVRSLLG